MIERNSDDSEKEGDFSSCYLEDLNDNIDDANLARVSSNSKVNISKLTHAEKKARFINMSKSIRKLKYTVRAL